MSESSTPTTIHQLQEVLRVEDDLTVALAIQDSIESLTSTGEVSPDTLLTEKVLSRIKEELKQSLLRPGASQSFSIANLFAGPQASIGSVNPVAAGERYLDRIKPVPEQSETSFTVGALGTDSLNLLPRAIAKLGWTSEQPLIPPMLDQLYNALTSIASEHFNQGGTWQGHAYSDYNGNVFYRFREMRDQMYEQELQQLIDGLSNTPAERLGDSVRRCLVITYLWLENIRVLSSSNSRAEQHSQIRKKIINLYQKLKEFASTRQVNFDSIEQEVRNLKDLCYTS